MIVLVSTTREIQVHTTAAGPPAPAPAADPKPPAAEEKSLIERLRVIGGLVAVGMGVLVVGLLAGYAINKDPDSAATIAGSAGGVIATMVGAYFGVKVGTDQSKAAAENQKAEAAKAQVYAAYLDPQKAPDILDLAKQAAKDALG